MSYLYFRRLASAGGVGPVCAWGPGPGRNTSSSGTPNLACSTAEHHLSNENMFWMSIGTCGVSCETNLALCFCTANIILGTAHAGLFVDTVPVWYGAIKLVER